MEFKTYEWLEQELNDAKDEREDINNKLDKIIKHLNIEDEKEDNLDEDDFSSDSDELDL